MIGAFTQLNIIPYAITALNLNEVAGGYLFLTLALGIAGGAFLAGKLSTQRAELGLSCLAGVGITVFFFSLFLFSSSLPLVIVALLCMGLCGGCFIIPFDTFTQLFSQNTTRGQTIAAANFLSFVGVFLASCLLYFLNNTLSLTPATSFGVMGLMTLIVTLTLTSVLSDLSIPFISKCLLTRFTPFRLPEKEHLDSLKQPLIVIEHATWNKALKVAACFPSICFLVPSNSPLRRSYMRFIYAVNALESDSVETALATKREGTALCLLLDTTPEPLPKSSLLSLFKRSTPSIYKAEFKETTLSFKKPEKSHKNLT
jgi:acyl-[acyl-carrier-protein]-phospholipid O-acyltransferase/long-chain-fatty-acid--[acyl-carrier-protein] ligase